MIVSHAKTVPNHPDAIDSLLQIVLSYFGNQPYTATITLKDLLELNLNLPYVLSVGSVIARNWHIFFNEVATQIRILPLHE